MTRKIRRGLLVCLIITPVAYFILLAVMYHVGYEGRGVASEMSELPFGVGRLFGGLQVDGDIHYAYGTSPRGATCLFSGTTSEQAVRSFCSEGNGWESDVVPAEGLEGWVRDYSADPDVFLGHWTDEDFAVSKEAEDLSTIWVMYRHTDGRVLVYFRGTWKTLDFGPEYLPKWWQ